ncbi:MAG TPA: T9SS type A sorting domain-containing protein, partial [Bacteroidetes bacterium]|nr:T9SS type A sorting domain-containing protein [Bacteroidota bacterium]
TVSGNGSLYAVYPSYAISQSPLPKFIIAKSNDGGQSFSYNTVISTASTVNNLYAKKGYLVSADPSNPKHLIFLSLTNNSGVIDVGISETYDGGNNWTHLNKINDDNTFTMQDMVWGDFNEKGDYIATWRDRRKALNDSYSNPYEFWAAVKYKDSTSFSKNFRISDTIIQFDDLLLKNGNDFMSTAFVIDTLYSVWGDTRNGKLNIWFQKMPISDKTTSNTQIISEESIPEINIYPNPSRDYIIIEGSDISEICIFDLKGQKIRSIKLNTIVNKYKIENLSAGIYNLRIKTKAGIAYKRIICEKY